MKAPLKLALFGLSLTAVFAVMFVAGKTFIPDSAVSNWIESAEGTTSEHAGMGESGSQGQMNEHPITGVSIESRGFVLRDLKAPATPGVEGTLAFQIETPGGTPLTDFEERHEKELHLITVRTDGAGYRHAHPKLDPTTGTWSIPWRWDLAGSQQVYVDFATPGEPDDLTLARSFDVAGEFRPRVIRTSPIAFVDGYAVELSGDLVAGRNSDLEFRVLRDGEPVSDLQPYLGAFGHLVVLREGDQAYLHAHAEVDENVGAHDSHGAVEARGGPDLGFEVGTPTEGPYLLYLDFKVDGKVHTAEFIAEAK